MRKNKLLGPVTISSILYYILYFFIVAYNKRIRKPDDIENPEKGMDLVF